MSCPWCGCEALECDTIDIVVGSIYGPSECPDCGAREIPVSLIVVQMFAPGPEKDTTDYDRVPSPEELSKRWYRGRQ